MVSDTTVENACLENVSQAPVEISLRMPEQAAGKLKLMHGGRDILQVLLRKVAFNVCWS